MKLSIKGIVMGIKKINFKDIFKKIFICLFVLSIPLMLCLYAIKAREYTMLSKEVAELEEREERLIEENQRLINDIASLTSAERIENMAVEELGMHKAESEDIVRVEMTGEKD